MTFQAFILLSLVSLFIGFVLALYLGIWFKNLPWWQRALIQSIALATFLGIGIIGGGGEPGFALPAPVVPAFFLETGEWRLYNAVYPFLFWLAVYLVFFVTKHIWKSRKSLNR